MFSDSKIAEIRERSDIVEIIGEYITLKKTGANYKGVCPFHADSDPSFSVNPNKQFYYCFGCSESGDVFSFVQKADGLSFIDTVKKLANRYGIALPEKQLSEAEKTKQDLARDAKKRRLYVIETATVFFEQILWSEQGARGREMLIQRGISEETARHFRLGFAPDAWDGLLNHLKKNAISSQEAEQNGLALPRRNHSGHYDRFRNRLVFTITDSAGNPIAFSARAVVQEDNSAKYINSPETPEYVKGKVLYGLHPARIALSKQKEAVLVEGNFDVVAMHEAGFHNVVAPLGTAFTSEQAMALRRRVDKVTVMFDGDGAGMRAAASAFPVLADIGVSSYIAVLPTGEDPDSLIRSGGKQRIAEILEARRGLLDEIISRKAGATDGTAQDVAAGISELRPLLNALKDSMMRDVYRAKIAEAFNVEPSVVFRHIRTNGNKEEVRKSTRTRTLIPGYIDERELIGLLLDIPSLGERAREMGAIEKIKTQELKELAGQLVENSRTHSSANAALMDGAANSPARNWMAQRALEKVYTKEEAAAEALVEISRKMDTRIIGEQIATIERQMQRAHTSGDDMMVFTLQRKMTELQKQIHGVDNFFDNDTLRD